MKEPVIIYCCKGWVHICYAVWSIRSLLRFDYSAIEVIVSNTKEKDFIEKKLPDIVCTVVDVNIGGYPVFSYKPFVLERFLMKVGIAHDDRDVVICDTDVIWKKDPKKLFLRFNGMYWVHKITAIDSDDYMLSADDVSQDNIGLITILNYKQRFEISKYPNFRVNAGLFMVKQQDFQMIIDDWMSKIRSLPPNQMKMSEALLSLTYAENDIQPSCDQEDIKHYGVEKTGNLDNLASFNAVNRVNEWEHTGYQTAQHYFGDQRKLMFEDALEMGLDQDDLMSIIRRNLLLSKIKKIPSKIIRILQNRVVNN